jgi:16S rRNA (guanine1516-N2)-methyltransferase
MSQTVGVSDAHDYLRKRGKDVDKNLNIVTTDDGSVIELFLPPDRLRFRHSYVESGFFKRAQQSNQALLKACNNRHRDIHTVLDLTGGWGMDSFILAQHGQRVTMIEHDRLIYSISTHSLECARSIRRSKAAANRIETIHFDALEFLQTLGKQEHFDCIYLDPMFPSHHSSAKPAGEMQILQYLTRNDDIDPCFDLALRKASSRVVVKRPAKAGPLVDLSPELVFREKSIRFDVYLIPGPSRESC